MEKNTNVPRLRFPEFEGEWAEKKLGEIAERVISKNKENNLNVLTISAQNGLISQLEFFNKSVSAKDVTGYYLLNKDDFAYNKSYSNGYPMGAIKRLTRYEKGIVSTLYICFRNKPEFDNSFAEQYFEAGLQNSELEKVAQEGARNHGLLNIGVSDFFNIELTIPSLFEQTKIASFLTAADNKLTQLKKKKSLLEEYKKGVMQKIFSQELRFKDDNGEDFPEWEEKRLGDIATFSKGKGLSKADISDDGEIECIRYGELYTKYNEVINEVYSKTNVNKTKLVLSEANDVIIPASGETQIDIATASCVIKSGVALGGDLNIIKTINNGVFLSYYLNNRMKTEIANLAQGISVIHLYSKQLALLNISIPSLPEQTKIATFLSAIDERINHCSKQIERMEEWKKGLLQQMFC
jgi:type I restriction enzyme, S subunit